MQKLIPWVNIISKIPVDGKWWSLGWSSRLQIPRVTFIRPPDTASPLHLRRVCSFWKLSLTLMPGSPCPIFSSFLCSRNSISSVMYRNRDFSQEAQTLLYLPVPVMFAIVVVQSLSCFWLSVTPRTTPGFPVLHYLPEFAKTHIHWVNDTIQPSRHRRLISSWRILWQMQMNHHRQTIVDLWCDRSSTSKKKKKKYWLIYPSIFLGNSIPFFGPGKQILHHHVARFAFKGHRVLGYWWLSPYNPLTTEWALTLPLAEGGTLRWELLAILNTLCRVWKIELTKIASILCLLQYQVLKS